MNKKRLKLHDIYARSMYKRALASFLFKHYIIFSHHAIAVLSRLLLQDCLKDAYSYLQLLILVIIVVNFSYILTLNQLYI